jgi:DNA-binding transcriptional MerR regulator
MTTVGRLAKQYGLSRSTLLYYHRIGLLKPTGHQQGDYRHYTDADQARLKRIMYLRSAGLKLDEIKTMLESPRNDTVTDILEQRLMAMFDEIERLKTAQHLTARLLGVHKTTAREEMNKAT